MSVTVSDGQVEWFPGYGPERVTGPCGHPGCGHDQVTVIAWGPDSRLYELVRCDAGCGGQCRAWVDARGVATTAWLAV